MAGTVERTFALKLIGDVSGIRKDLAKTDRALGRTAKAAASWGKALGGALVLGGLERLVDASVEGVKAFREEQDAVRNFGRSVKNLGVPAKGATKALDRMADAAVGLGFDDGDMIRGMDQFLRMTGSIERATRANALAMDIARGKGITLAQAQREVEGIYNGSARTLRRYGLEGVKGMEAVTAAAAKEKGKAREWARHHPMEVLLGRISDGWADVVGNLSQGNLGAAVKAGAKLAANIARGITGYTTKEGKRVKGLWDRLFDSTPDKAGKPKGIISRLGQDIADEIGKVDWGKSLGDALSAGLDGLKGLVDSGGLTQIAAVGAAITAGLFVVDAAVAALTALFSVPKLLVKGVIGAITTVGASIAATMFGAEKVTQAAGETLASTITSAGNAKGVKGAATAVGTLLGGWMAPALVAVVGAGLLAWMASNGPPQPGVSGNSGGAGLPGVPVGPIPIPRGTTSTRTRNNQRNPFRRPLGKRAEEAGAEARRKALLPGEAGSMYRRIIKGMGPSGGGLTSVWRQHSRDRRAKRRSGRGAGFARGTPSAPPGWAWTGEDGPELLRFRGGERVMDHRRSMAMAAAGGPPIVIPITVNGYVGSEEQLARHLNRILAAGVQRGMRLGSR